MAQYADERRNYVIRSAILPTCDRDLRPQTPVTRIELSELAELRQEAPGPERMAPESQCPGRPRDVRRTASDRSTGRWCSCRSERRLAREVQSA